MDIEYSGFSEAHGAFSFMIPVDETKENFEIRMKDGSIMRQNGPFQSVTRDWNCDGDVYTLFGAYFICDGRGEFITPVDMVRFVVDGDAEIPGISNPFQQHSLDDQIEQAGSRCKPNSVLRTNSNDRYR